MAFRTTPQNVTDYIRFGEIARDLCGMQCQYARHYLAGNSNTPSLGDDLRWYGDTERYHNLMIHREDVDEFVRRVLMHRSEGMMG